MALIHSGRGKKCDRSIFMVMISWAVMFPFKSCGYPDNQWDRIICAVFGPGPVPHQAALITPTIPALWVLLSAEMPRVGRDAHIMWFVCKAPHRWVARVCYDSQYSGHYRELSPWWAAHWEYCGLQPSTEWREWSRHSLLCQRQAEDAWNLLVAACPCFAVPVSGQQPSSLYFSITYY